MVHGVLVAHPPLLVRATSERILPGGVTLRVGLASVGTHRSLVVHTSLCGWVVSLQEWCDLLGLEVMLALCEYQYPNVQGMHGPKVMLALCEYRYPNVQGMHGPSNCGHFHLQMMNFGSLDCPNNNWLVQFSCVNYKDLHVKFRDRSWDVNP